MLSLEHRAKQLFEEYSVLQGKAAQWEYLNPQRQLTWMRDTYFIAIRIIEDMRDQMQCLDISTVDTSWGQGYNQGVLHERIKLMDALNNFEQDLENQIEEFKQKHELS